MAPRFIGPRRKYTRKPKVVSAVVVVKPKAKRKTGYTSTTGGKMTNFIAGSIFKNTIKNQMIFSGVMLLTVARADTNFGDEFAYRMNSIFDPYVGTTPALDVPAYGWAVMIALYRRYKVTALTVEVLFADPNLDGIMVGMQVNNIGDVTPLQGQSSITMGQKPMSWVRYLSNTGNQQVKFKQTFQMYSILGMTKSQYDNDITSLTSSLVTGSPVSTPYLRIAVADSNASFTTKTVNARIILTYHTEWKERIPLSA